MRLVSLTDLLLLFIVLLVPAGAAAPLYQWTTVASRASQGSDDGPVATARFYEPHGLAADSAGSLYVADTANQTIRKITPEGIVSTLAGAVGLTGSADGTGSIARFNQPDSLAVDAAGNVYVADTGNYLIRRITPGGLVSTLAGIVGTKGAVDGPAASATFQSLGQLAVDGAGKVYVLDQRTIRVIANGQVSTLYAGGSTLVLSSNTTVTVYVDGGLAVDEAGQVFFSGTLDRGPVEGVGRQFYPALLKRDTQGVISILYGGPPYYGDGAIQSLGRLALDHSGNVYMFVSSWIEGMHSPIWRVGPDGTAAQIDAIKLANGADAVGYGLTVNPAGEFFYTREDNVVVKSGAVYAGTGAGTAGWQNPLSLTVDPTGNVWVADYRSMIIYGRGSSGVSLSKVTPAGEATTVIRASFQYEFNYDYPPVVAAGPDGSVNFLHGYFSQNTLTKIPSDGTNTSESFGVVPPGNGYEFGQPRPFVKGMVADQTGNLIVPDASDHVIWLRSVAGTWSVLAGAQGQAGRVDGTGAFARFGGLSAVTMDRAGNFYVLDAGDPAAGGCVIRQITPTGTVTTISGDLTKVSGVPGISAYVPTGLTVDNAGIFYLAYGWGGTVWSLTPAGEMTLIGGTPGLDGTSDGIGPAARFLVASGVATDAQGRIFVIDSLAGTLRMGTVVTIAPQLTTQPQSVTAAVGGSVQFSVAATGTPPPNYQWRLGGVPISGATSSSLSLTNVQSANAGSYSVTVSNSAGSVTSAVANLSITSGNSSGSGSGGGSPGLGFYSALAVLIALRRCIGRKRDPVHY